MNKALLSERVSQSLNLPISRSMEVTDHVLSELIRILVEDGKLLITGLGTFETVERAERTRRNPKTGETFQVGPDKTVKFRPSAGLRAYVNGDREIGGQLAVWKKPRD